MHFRPEGDSETSVSEDMAPWRERVKQAAFARAGIAVADDRSRAADHTSKCAAHWTRT